MMLHKKILVPLPRQDFDPTETAVPWRLLRSNGIEVYFATPEGLPGECDERMLTGKGLGPLAPLLSADKNGRDAYNEMIESHEFKNPLSWENMTADAFDGIILPGGHAKGMREYLESEKLKDVVQAFF